MATWNPWHGCTKVSSGSAPWLQEYHSEIELVSCVGESGDDFVTSPGVISEISTVLPCRT